MKLSRAFVAQWSGRYIEFMDDEEARLLNEVGPRLREHGCYTRDELVTVGTWKSPRIRSRLEHNSDADTHDITSIALAAPERLQHRVLCLLNGIQVRAATALLTVWQPETHTVMDVRSLGALDALGELPSGDVAVAYPEYLQVCRGISRRLRVDLRSLDRALWRWDRDGQRDHP